MLCGILLFLVLICLTAGMFFLKMKEENLEFWEKLPRNRTAGGVLGTVALLAFIPNVKPLFSPEENLIWLIPAALILALLCYLYLDYLFARAAAGGLILLAHWLLNEVFNADLRGGSFFSLLSLAAGTYAIFIAAKPYWLRDSFRAMCRKWKWRLTGSVFAFLWALSASILLVQLAGKMLR